MNGYFLAESGLQNLNAGEDFKSAQHERYPVVRAAFK